MANKKKWTFVALVLDRSGSMTSIRDEALTGFNEQLEVIKENSRKGGRTRVMMVTFNQAVDELFSGRTAGKVDPLTHNDYRPEGMTAMYDAVGHVIRRLDNETPMGEEVGPNDEVAFLVVVVSDGYENASREWTGETLANEVKRLQDKGTWSFVYIGANQDLAELEKHLPFNNYVSFTATASGANAVFDNLRTSTTQYFSDRSAGLTQTTSYSGDLRTDTKE